MSKTRILIHVVFATKDRRPTITNSHKRELYGYLYGIIKNHKSVLYQMNGMPDHIHMLIDLNPTIALADLVKAMKQSSNIWLHSRAEFKDFEKWGEGYYAASIGPEHERACREYIKRQENHHAGKEFINEMKEISMTYHLEWDERDW